MSIRNNILTIILFAMSVCGYAQNFQVNARIDSTVIYIGQQCNVTFDISQRPDLKVITPVFKDTLAKGIEIVEYTTDTIADKDGYITVRQNYLVTAFDSALYYIPEFPFVAGGDTVFAVAKSAYRACRYYLSRDCYQRYKTNCRASDKLAFADYENCHRCGRICYIACCSPVGCTSSEKT